MLLLSAVGMKEHGMHTSHQQNEGPLTEDRPTVTVTFVGHATVIIQVGDVRVITDPMWSERSYPIFGSKRLSSPGIPLDSLPRIDAVVISHNHFDHLDAYSIEQIWKRFGPIFVVPQGLRKWFGEEQRASVRELRWWDSIQLKGVTITCVPASHRGSTIPLTARSEDDLCAGWIVSGDSARVLFAGDTRYFSGFRQMRERFGPISVALLPIGPFYGEHMFGYDVVRASKDLQAEYLIPIHWGTFEQDPYSLDLPLRMLVKAMNESDIRSTKLIVLQEGESAIFDLDRREGLRVVHRKR